MPPRKYTEEYRNFEDEYYDYQQRFEDEYYGYAEEEDIYLLKMTCPSTGYIHVVRVPPDIQSAKEAITWVNQGIAPEDFAVET